MERNAGIVRELGRIVIPIVILFVYAIGVAHWDARSRGSSPDVSPPIAAADPS